MSPLFVRGRPVFKVPYESGTFEAVGLWSLKVEKRKEKRGIEMNKIMDKLAKKHTQLPVHEGRPTQSWSIFIVRGGGGGSHPGKGIDSSSVSRRGRGPYIGCPNCHVPLWFLWFCRSLMYNTLTTIARSYSLEHGSSMAHLRLFIFCYAFIYYLLHSFFFKVAIIVKQTMALLGSTSLVQKCPS